MVASAGDREQTLPYLPPSLPAIAQAEAGQVAILAQKDHARIAAVTKLAQYPGQYLYVVRGVSPKVMGHLHNDRAERRRVSATCAEAAAG